MELYIPRNLGVFCPHPGPHHRSPVELLVPKGHSELSSNMLKRPALGQIASLGTFYDARNDSFVHGLSLLRTAPPPAAVTTTDMHKTDIKFSKTDSYTEKFDRLGVRAELSASFLAG